MRRWLVLLALALGFAQAQTTLTVLTYDGWPIQKSLLKAFEASTHIQVHFIQAGDAGAELNRAILTKNSPIADVIIGFDNALLPRALKAGVLERYIPPEASQLRAGVLLDPTFHAIPLDWGYVALTYDRAYFKDHPLPTSLAELATPEYAKLLVTENPATSTPGLDFMLATIKAFGPKQFLDFWYHLRQNGLKVDDGWTQAYYTDFSAHGGKRPIVVSYTTDPAAEIYYSEAHPKPTQPPVGNLLFPDGTFREVEFMGILKGTHHRKAAEQFISFLLSKPFQLSNMTENWMYPAIQGITYPPVYRYAELPTHPAELSEAEIAKNLRLWIREWTEVVLQGETPSQVLQGQ